MAEHQPRTVGELRAAGYVTRTVRDELRRNLMLRLSEGADIFPGIVGYDDTVLPQVENAILSGQDIILLGERGQAKSRLIRALVELLDAHIPVLDGPEIPEDPFAPISAQGRALIAEHGDAAPIRWMPREERYSEKLATPDITIADLIGEIDPIRIAEGRHLGDELALHYGLIPRTNRGIFAINELPDLAERIQVGLLNLLEERDIQIRGFKIRMPLDVLVVATANPEDYTNRGRIITPLKDRYGAQIRTHYPASIEDEMRIMDLECASLEVGDYRVTVPGFMKEIIAELVHLARDSADISQRSGVSVRASVACLETTIANALRRAVRTGEFDVVPRVSDLPFCLGSLAGKVEFETMEEGREEEMLEKLLSKAVIRVFDRHVRLNGMEPIVAAFAEDTAIETAEHFPSSAYEDAMRRFPILGNEAARIIPRDTPALRASALELILEGLHLHRMLNKDRVGTTSRYRS